jgi:hypothetical protein
VEWEVAVVSCQLLHERRQKDAIRPYKISPFAARWSDLKLTAWINDVKDGFEGKEPNSKPVESCISLR